MWWNIAILAVTSLINSLTARRPQGPQRPTLSELEIPNSEEGQPVRIAFGTPYGNSPSIVWYDNLRLDPVRSKGGKK